MFRKVTKKKLRGRNAGQLTTIRVRWIPDNIARDGLARVSFTLSKDMAIAHNYNGGTNFAFAVGAGAVALLEDPDGYSPSAPNKTNAAYSTRQLVPVENLPQLFGTKEPNPGDMYEAKIHPTECGKGFFWQPILVEPKVPTQKLKRTQTLPKQGQFTAVWVDPRDGLVYSELYRWVGGKLQAHAHMGTPLKDFEWRGGETFYYTDTPVKVPSK